MSEFRASSMGARRRKARLVLGLVLGMALLAPVSAFAGKKKADAAKKVPVIDYSNIVWPNPPAIARIGIRDFMRLKKSRRWKRATVARKRSFQSSPQRQPRAIPYHAQSSPLPQPSLLVNILDEKGLASARLVGTQLFCTDCHNSDDNREFGGAGPNGPHGSINSHILERNYQFSQAAIPGGPATNLFLIPIRVLPDLFRCARSATI